MLRKEPHLHFFPSFFFGKKIGTAATLQTVGRGLRRSPKMQWWSLLALADLFVINRPHTLQRPKESRSATVASNGVGGNSSSWGAVTPGETLGTLCPSGVGANKTNHQHADQFHRRMRRCRSPTYISNTCFSRVGAIPIISSAFTM